MHRCLVIFLLSWGCLTAAIGRPADPVGNSAGSKPRASATAVLDLSTADWPWWRGPTRNGVAASDQRPPLEWSETSQVLWKAPLPGRGHGAPTVVGDRVFLATADHEREAQILLCFDRHDGRPIWQIDIHQRGFTAGGNKKSSLASSTPACDGRAVYINFLNDGAVWTTALGMDGQQLWQTRISDYVLHQGYGSSPAVHGDLLIVSADNKGGGAVAGLNRTTGQVVWRRQRPKTPNYASPVILNTAGREQLLFIGCDLVTSLDPTTGEELWEIDGATTECVTSTVTDGQLIFTSGGYPKNHLAAVRADGSGTIAWENGSRVYVPSLIVRDGFLYGVLDEGIAACWRCDTGEEQWRERLGGTFSASPVLVGDRLYATNEEGTTFVFRADPAEFTLLAENQLGDEVFATPAICGGRIYQRVAFHRDGGRQEVLYCLGEAE